MSRLGDGSVCGVPDCPCGGLRPATLGENDKAYGNRRVLGNGCVCDSGCESCGRLAEAFEAMREILRDCPYPTEALYRNARTEGGSDCLIREVYDFHKRARAALALADAVSKVSR